MEVVGKIYASILVDRVRRGIGGLIGDEQGGFRAGIDQIFTLKQRCEIMREKMQCMWVL